MGKIIKIGGNVKQERDNEFLLLADKQCIFGIDDSGIETGKGKLTWILKNAKEAEIYKKQGEWNNKFFLTLNKKSSGNYRYKLSAFYVNSKSITTTYPPISVGGYCEPKITNAYIDLPQKIGCAVIKAPVTIEAEGLNGNLLSLDADFAGTCLSTKPVQCVEGKAVFTIEVNTFSLIKEVLANPKGVNKSLKIKVQDSAGNSIKDGAGKEVVIEHSLTVSGLVSAAKDVIKNNTISSVKQPDKIKIAVNGILELTNFKFKYQGAELRKKVCNDEYDITTTPNVKNQWILSGNYHWLETRSAIEKDFIPEILPVTFPCGSEIEIHFSLTCRLDITDAYVRVSDKKYNTQFDVKKTGSMNKGNTLPLSVKSKNVPFDSIRYIPDYELFFEYSLDNKVWIPLGGLKFCLYLTKRTCSLPGNFVQESLLYWGCEQCNKMKPSVSDENIMDAIFTRFENQKLYRRRESERRPNGSKYFEHTFEAGSAEKGLGYWRGASMIRGAARSGYPAFNDYTRSWKYLLAYGDARCGEWTELLLKLLEVQGISIVGDARLAICTDYLYTDYGYNTYRYTSPSFNRNKKSFSFAVANAKQNDVSIPGQNPPNSSGITPGVSGQSAAQGNSSAQAVFFDHVFVFYNDRFYDPSYGVSYSKLNSNLKVYCKDNITTVIIEHKLFSIPTPIFAGLTSPSIIDKDTHNYIRADKDKFI